MESSRHFFFLFLEPRRWTDDEDQVRRNGESLPICLLLLYPDATPFFSFPLWITQSSKNPLSGSRAKRVFIYLRGICQRVFFVVFLQEGRPPNKPMIANFGRMGRANQTQHAERNARAAAGRRREEKRKDMRGVVYKVPRVYIHTPLQQRVCAYKYLE